MNKINNYWLILSFILMPLLFSFNWGCKSNQLVESSYTDTLFTLQANEGLKIELDYRMGKMHNHPLMAVWVCNSEDEYLETLYVAESIAKGVFNYGDKSTGKWMPGEIRRPAALPVWAHSRGVKELDGLYVPTSATAMPDAVTGATPLQNFVLKSKLSRSDYDTIRIYFEINQSWDWNEHWTNNKFPGNKAYKTSCQPSLVYMAEISNKDFSGNKVHVLNLIGHGHYSGDDGKIYTDLSTITTAKEITRAISLKIIK